MGTVITVSRPWQGGLSSGAAPGLAVVVL